MFDANVEEDAAKTTQCAKFQIETLEPRILLSATWGGATAGDDVFAGTVDDDIADGLAGNDTLIGGVGNDTLTGGDGRLKRCPFFIGEFPNLNSLFSHK